MCLKDILWLSNRENYCFDDIPYTKYRIGIYYWCRKVRIVVLMHSSLVSLLDHSFDLVVGCPDNLNEDLKWLKQVIEIHQALPHFTYFSS